MKKKGKISAKELEIKKERERWEAYLAQKKKEKIANIRGFLILIGVILIIIILQTLFGKKYYSGKYLVYACNDKDQCYTQRADLSINENSYEEISMAGYEREVTEKFNQVDKLYFNNGGYLEFTECDPDENKFCTSDNDPNGPRWKFTIIKKIE